jgi:N-acetyltransferase
MKRRTYKRIFAPTIESEDRPLKRQRVDISLGSDVSNTTLESDNGSSTAGEPSQEVHTSDTSILESDFSFTSSNDGVNAISSSPPLENPKPALKPSSRKPIFSYFRQINASDSAGSTSKPKKMKQLTLDVGQRPTNTCSECGMTFTPSQKRDVALHDTFHAQKAGKAKKLSNQLLKSTERNVVWSDVGRGEKIIRITRRDDASKRKFAEQILEGVAEDLGAIHLSEAVLWSQEHSTSKSNGVSKYDKYHVFLFTKDHLCVGLLLAERIQKARRVTKPDAVDSKTLEDAAITASVEYFPAVIGVSRIWACGSFRRSGIATKLLSVASENFQPLVNVGKDLVAFSQPTDMGARLARKWFNKEIGWLVYDG